jgi:hypothetical protein
VENLPYKFDHTFTFTATETGKHLKFKLEATNELGTTMSDDYLEVLLAGIPPKPPTNVGKLFSNKEFIAVEMPEVTDNGGSTLNQYELETDDGLQSQFSSFYVGLNRTVEVPVTLGRTYRFRYRVNNVIGWSDYSDVTYILAAYVPDKPIGAPLLVSVDQT